LRDHPEHRRALRWFRMAARDESLAREIDLASLLILIAELAAHPQRLAQEEERAAALLREHGFIPQANLHDAMARISRTDAPDLADRLIRAITWHLGWHFGLRADRIAAELAGTALMTTISHRHARYAVKS
jgi:hypothetical protein